MKPHTHVYIPNGASEICVHCGEPPAVTNKPSSALHFPNNNAVTSLPYNGNGVTYRPLPYVADTRQRIMPLTPKAIENKKVIFANDKGVTFGINPSGQITASYQLPLTPRVKVIPNKSIKVTYPEDGYPWLSWEHEQFDSL